jgi:hypothetical protein
LLAQISLHSFFLNISLRRWSDVSSSIR